MKRRGDDGTYGAPAKKLNYGGYAAGRLDSVGQHSRLTTNDALTYLRDVKNKFQEDRQVYETFLEIMKDFKAQNIDTAGVIERVKTLFKGHKNLIIGFNTFLPKGYEIKMEDLIREEEEAARANKTPVEFDQAINYVNKIKDRFRKDERVYKQFLEILNQYRKNQKGIAEVYNQVASLFRSHDDLLEEFTYFLPDSQAPHQAAQNERIRRAELESHRQPSLEREAHIFDKIRKKLPQASWVDFLKLLNMFAQDLIGRQELLDLAQEMFGGKHSELYSAFSNFLQRCPYMDIDESAAKAVGRQMAGRHKDKLSAKDKNTRLPISEMNLADCQRCTPSYVMLPRNFVKLEVSNREALGQELSRKLPFNDTWVSVTSGSEDYSFKLMRKNQYEEALFRVEDDRYELEMHIERNKSTMAVMRPIAARMEALSPEEKQNAKLEEGELSPVQLRHIAAIYGEQGPQVVDLLKKNPSVALPVIQQRLQQKDEEWKRVLHDMEKHWQRMFEQNYARSLDHRSFYFKQTDKRTLGNKTMVQELREAAETRRQSPVHCLLLDTSAPPAIRLQPDLVYDMKSKAVHNDVWLVLKAASRVAYSQELAGSIQQFWTNLVAPFFKLDSPESDVVAANEAKVQQALIKIKEIIPTPAGTPGQPPDMGNGTSAPPEAKPPAEPVKSVLAGSSLAPTLKLAGAEEKPPPSAADKAAAAAQVASSAPTPPATTAAAPAAAAALAPVPAAELNDESASPRDVPSAIGEARGGAAAAAAAPEAAASPAPRSADDVPSEDEEEDFRRSPEESEEEEEARASEEDEEREMDVDTPDRAGAAPPPADAPLQTLELVSVVDDSAVKAGNLWHVAPVQPVSPPKLKLNLPNVLPHGEPADEHDSLYANENLYIFYRLYHHMFDRLRTARVCLRDRLEAKKPGGNFGLVRGEQAALAGENGAKEGENEELDALHAKFLALVQRLVTNKLDSAAFEDECRSMLGANGYVLFTLDKLVSKMLKLISTMLADDACVKLINLHHYEKRRKRPASSTTRMVNASAIFAEEHCIRLAYLDCGQLTVQLVDFERPDAQPWPSDPDAQKYLTSFMAVTSDQALREAVDGPPKLLLRRNLNRQMLQTRDARVDHIASFIVRNGLESKLKQDEPAPAPGPMIRKAALTRQNKFCYKINFVLDTEDAIVRRSVLRPKAASADAAAARLAAISSRRERAQRRFHVLWEAQRARILRQTTNEATSNLGFRQPQAPGVGGDTEMQRL